MSELKKLENQAMSKKWPTRSQWWQFLKILDRREAIKVALKFAKKDDIVIITGKGCEPWLCVVGGKKIPWDDREVVREEFQKFLKK